MYVCHISGVGIFFFSIVNLIFHAGVKGLSERSELTPFFHLHETLA